MELKINIGYKQIPVSINQLPIKDKERIANILQSEITGCKHPKISKEMILDAPVWNDSDISDYTEARKHINISRIA